MFMVVVFPQPEGPSRAMNEPCGTSRLSAFTATTPPKSFVSVSSLICAIATA